MCAIPNKDIDEDETPLEAIRKMNRMAKILINVVKGQTMGETWSDLYK